MRLTSLLLCAIIAAAPALADPARDAIEAAVASEHRSEANRARDAWRNPVETLAFFGLEPDMHVVEIWPGKGWYTEILAPLLAEEGQLTVAVFGDQANQFRDYLMRINSEFLAHREANPDVFGEVEVTELWAPGQVQIAPPGSQDAVLTFRNLHNWMKWGQTDDVLAAAHRALKPGGILGVVDHRAPTGTVDPLAETGYVDQQQAIDLIEKAGFELVEVSQINANPRDTADHPRGVWTLPPTLALGETDREKYLAIGESDRFTLKFRKPAE